MGLVHGGGDVGVVVPCVVIAMIRLLAVLMDLCDCGDGSDGNKNAISRGGGCGWVVA